MCRSPATAIQATMICTRPTRVPEGVAQGAAGTMEPDRRIVGRYPQVAGHLVERLATQLNPSNQLCLFQLQ
jgi:hypothetical protein